MQAFYNDNFFSYYQYSAANVFCLKLVGEPPVPEHVQHKECVFQALKKITLSLTAMSFNHA